MARKTAKDDDEDAQPTPTDDGASEARGDGAALPPLGPLGEAIRASAQQIWQAGLGAFAKAQGEGGKVFESLVREGIALQRRTQAVAGEHWGEVGSRVQRLSGEVQSRAAQRWDRLEGIVESRVAQALGRLGLPSRREIDALAARLDALQEQVEALARAGGARTTARGAARATPPARAAAARHGASPAAGAAPRSARAAAASPAASSAAASPAKPRRKPRATGGGD